MEQELGNPHFSSSECNDIDNFFHEPGGISFPAVESTTANQRMQYALQEGDFFSVTNPQHRILPTANALITSSVETGSSFEEGSPSHSRNKEREETGRDMVVLPLHLSTIRYPHSGIFPSISRASSVVEQLLQPLHSTESPRRGLSNNDNDTQRDEEKQAIEDFHKSCASNFFFFFGAFFYFMMDWIDVYDVFLFPNKGYSMTDAYVLVFWNRTITTLELEEYESNYTMEYYDISTDSTYYANNYGESESNINSTTSTFARYTEVLKKEPLVTVSISMCFYILGSLCFLLNAIIDFRWAKRLVNEVKLKRKSKTGSQEFPPLSAQTITLHPPREWCISSASCQITSSSSSDDIELYRKQLQNTTMAELFDTNEQHGHAGCGSSSTITRRVVADVHKLPPCQIQIRRAFYPRRETSVKEKIAVLFGLAAVIDFVAALCYDAAPKMSNDAYIIAAHLYAAQAFVSIFGKKTSSSSSSSLPSITLLPSAEDVGDTLFFAGSMIDVIMSYFYALPRMEKSATFVACSCFASALWLLDSIVYIISTARTRRHLYEDRFDEDESLIQGLSLSQCGPNSHFLEKCHDGSSHSVT